MGRSVEEYLATLYDWWDAVLDEARCARCHRPYRRHQTRERAAWEDGDHAQRLLVLRIRCPDCGVTHTVLPDFLTPYRRYLTPVREAVLTGKEPAPACDARTARRWISTFRARVTDAIAQVTALVLAPLPLSRHEPAFLTGTVRGVGGLTQARAIAERRQQGPPTASCLLGWVNQLLAPHAHGVV